MTIAWVSVWFSVGENPAFMVQSRIVADEYTSVGYDEKDSWSVGR